MLVNRRVFNVRRGRMDEVLALLKADRERTGVDYRIYAADIGTLDQVAIEVNFENMQDYEKGWADWGSTPEAAAFMEKWLELTKTGGKNEIWTLVE